MENITISRDDEGRMQRVYIKQNVLDPRELVALQEKLQGATLDFTIPADSLHLTLFHYGEPESLYRELVHINPSLEWETFLELFNILLLYVIEQEKSQITVRGDILTVFESNGMFYIVLKILKTEQLMRLREPLLIELHHFLSACGINRTEAFMRRSSNLQYQHNYPYNPHITLGIHSEGVQLPDIDVSDLEIVLGEQELVSVTYQ